MFESQQSQMHMIWLAQAADHQGREAVTEAQAQAMLGRLSTALRRLAGARKAASARRGAPLCCPQQAAC